MPRTKTVLWPVAASLVGGLSIGLLACRWRYRNASAEIDRQRLEGEAEAERLRLRLTTVSEATVSEGPVSEATVGEMPGRPETGSAAGRSVPAASTMSSSAVATRSVTGAGRSDRGDDLKRIKGIGPAIEQALHDIGIVSYEQIAGFTDADIERVSEALVGFPRRIERDDWVGSARRLIDARSEDLRD